MKCPTCNAWTKVLETRDGGVRRKRECANLHRFSTLESVIGQTGRSSTPAKEAATSSTEHLASLLTKQRKNPEMP